MSFSCVDSVFRLVISVGQRKKILILRGSIPYIPYMDPIFFLCPKLVTRRKKKHVPLNVINLTLVMWPTIR